MLSYFPEIYPDELVYSIVARYQRHTGLGKSHVNRALFENARQNPAFQLSGRLDYLAGQIPRQRQITSEQLIRHHTLYPYYRAFMSEADGHRLMGDLRVGAPRSFPSPRFVIALPRWLKFCPECFNNAIKSYGEGYWLRQHQLPAVLCCAIHKEVLRYSLASNSVASHRFQAATREMCPSNARPVMESAISRHRHDLVSLAEQIDVILKTERLRDPVKWHREMIRECRSKGLLDKRGITHKRLAAEIDQRFGYLRSEWPRVFDTTCFQSWVKRATRPYLLGRMKLHPVAAFLIERTLKELPKAKAPEPFGQGPWDCPNPLADHRGRRTARMTKFRHMGKGSYQATFSCHCGCSYSNAAMRDRSSPSKRSVRTIGPRLDLFAQWAFINGYSINDAVTASGLRREVFTKISKQNGTLEIWRKKRGPSGLTDMMTRFMSSAEGRGEDLES